jgi:FMN-dependent NADH-azoreductase
MKKHNKVTMFTSGQTEEKGKRMKILAINASHRGDAGHTGFLIDKLFQGATKAGADCELITLTKFKINRCLACEKCHTPEQHLRCVYDDKDSVRTIFNQMAAADLIIYATPVYVFGMSGLLKTFIDRMNATGDTLDLRMSQSGLMFHHIDRAICSKPFVTLVCCDNIESETPKNVLAYFRTFSKFMDAPQVGILVRNGGRLLGHGHDPKRAKQFPKINEIYAAYEQAGRELAIEGHIRRATERRANQEIIPVPMFGIFKRLPFKSFKRKFIEQAQKMQHTQIQ